MKKIYSLFAAVIVAASVNAQTTTFDFGAQGYSNAQVISSGTVNPSVTFTASINSGSNPPTYYTSGSAVRFYADSAGGDGGGMTFTSASGKKITDLVINTVASYSPAISYRVNGGAPVIVNAVGTTYTISGISANSTLSFKNANTGSTTQLRITTFTITSDANLAVGDVNATKANLVKNTIVGNTITFAAKADVQLVNMNGQVVKTASVNENTSLEVATLPKGTYIVTGTLNGKTVSQKIIKK